MLNNSIRYYSIAPMMGKTDSFFCFLMKNINSKTSIYTEMMHSESILRTKILDTYNLLNDLSNITVQIAGNNPTSMAKAAKKISTHGFSKININCGCPSKNVLAGEFGLSLLTKPIIARKCIEAIKSETNLDISVKTRIGINNNEDDSILDDFVNEISLADVNKYIIHARNGIIGKLNTKKNLSIPPLKYERVFKLKKNFLNKEIIINGGFLNTLEFTKYKNIVDGIMIGREAYRNPWIFAKKSITNKEKINIVIKYLNGLKVFFRNKPFNKKSISHIHNIYNNINGAKSWRKAVNYAVHNNDLHFLLNYINYNYLGKNV